MTESYQTSSPIIPVIDVGILQLLRQLPFADGIFKQTLSLGTSWIPSQRAN